jgi:hypothetical protein
MDEEPQYMAHGQSFESRCEGAKISLQDFSKLFVEITDMDFAALNEADADFAQRKTEDRSPAYLEILERMHNDHKELIRQHSADMLKTAWTGAINVLNVVWGEDAVTVAVEAIRHSKKPS